MERNVGRFQRTSDNYCDPGSGKSANGSKDANAIDVQSIVFDTLHTMVSRADQKNDIGASSIHRILNKHHYHISKIYLDQELSEDDCDRRVEFRNIMLKQFADNCQFFTGSLFVTKQYLS